MNQKVGIFWIYKNKIIGKTYSLSETEKYGDFLSPVLGHYDYWEQIQKEFPELYYEEYEYIPRGRIFYDTTKDHYVLLTSKKIIKNIIILKAIKEFFSIPDDAKFVAKSDLHYEIRCLGSRKLKTEN